MEHRFTSPIVTEIRDFQRHSAERFVPAPARAPRDRPQRDRVMASVRVCPEPAKGERR